MRILGFDISRAKALTPGQQALVTQVPAAAVSSTVVGPRSGGWWGTVRESFAGAWQRGVTVDSTEGLLANGAVYSCLDLISGDISKLRIKLVAWDTGSSIWRETSNSAFSPVLRKPNRYQTRIQFLSAWVLSKLIHGNTVVLKERDSRNVVVGLHVLNWRLVKVLVTEAGDVYYQISNQKLAKVQAITVPASEVIHDRGSCFYHHLVGVPPLFACAMSTSQANRIQANAAKFFENMSRPSGMLTAPDTIDDETAARLKAEFEANFGGANIGRLLIAGDGLEYKDLGTIPAQQAQLVEQLKWTVQDVCACFHVPLHKVAADSGVKFSNMGEMNQDYYSQTLQRLIEDIELLLDEGLGLAGDGTQTLGVELDLEGLLRMDPIQRSTRNANAIKAGYMSPNEARQTENLPPVKGGEEPYMQQQQYPLSVLVEQPAPGTKDTAKEQQLEAALDAIVAASKALDRRASSPETLQ